MNIISIVTPAHAPSVPFLREAYASLVEQEMPSEWDWQWVVQEDGQTGAVADALPDDPRVSIGTGRKAGAATTRNMALSRATGSLVKVLDADDRLTPGALARDITTFAEHDNVTW